MLHVGCTLTVTWGGACRMRSRILSSHTCLGESERRDRLALLFALNSLTTQMGWEYRPQTTTTVPLSRP